MISPGWPTPLGASVTASGTNFAVYSSIADRVQLCLFDDAGGETRQFDLHRSGDIWHCLLPDCALGQRYGFRVHGPYDPQRGLRCNPAKLLLDPYARAIAGEFVWNPAVFDYVRGDVAEQRPNPADSAPYVPRSVVCGSLAELPAGPRIPWPETVFYEAHVRGFTMRHPLLDEADRGSFDGMRHKEILSYIKALGVTAIELLPIHAFIDEQHLVDKGLRNYWGYNPIAYFAPQPRYAKHDAVGEFRDMVRAMHDAGLEVILDVVYNHTAEGDHLGPSLCFRGLDNRAYYSTEAGAPGQYVNDTGCGNTLQADDAQVQQLVLDSLRYWHQTMGVDGFRFDLAPILGRHNHGFSSQHPLLEAITSEPALQQAKLIAEPWDPGPAGYQLGNFPRRWGEWNDRYRDAVRRFWRSDPGSSGEFAESIRGSASIFDRDARTSRASVNLITSHDGFTLADVVSYKERHNQPNGEQNRDGHEHNFSCNYGVEGDTIDAVVVAQRRQHRLNLIASLLLSQGTPLLLAGDEFGHSQGGNNNAYAQDNATTWLDWQKRGTDTDLTSQVRELLALRRRMPLLRFDKFVHGRLDTEDGIVEIRWIRPDGKAMQAQDWAAADVLGLLISDTHTGKMRSALAKLINRGNTACKFCLPADAADLRLHVAFASADASDFEAGIASVPGQSIVVLASEA